MDKKDDESVYAIFHSVVKLNFKNTFKLMEKEGIHPGQGHLLMAIIKEEGISQNKLAKCVEVKPATITGMIKKMEKSGYVERKVDENDQRVLRVYTTQLGKELSSKLKNCFEGFKNNSFKNFTEDELIIFRRLLLQMKSNLESESTDN